MKKIINFKIKTHSNKTGKLTSLSFNKKFPIKVKRIFFINGRKNKTRGNHAHKKCSQLFVPLFGKFILNIKTPYKQKRIELSHLKKNGVLVPPKYWCSINFVTKNSVLMVACDKYYNTNDYLRNFREYEKYMGKK